MARSTQKALTSVIALDARPNEKLIEIKVPQIHYMYTPD